MKNQMLETIEKFHMISPKDTVSVALSGGADSVALLLALKECESALDFTLEAIHVEHGIRGEESLRDEQFVRALCEEKNIPLFVEKVDVPSYAKENGLGLEEAARKLRYMAFQKRGGIVAIAHHMEDQAETVLFQMARGSDLTGLCGIAPRRVDEEAGVTYIRPLLYVSKDEILDYLRTCNQPYCEDATNKDEAYSRNFIRHTLMGDLKQLNSEAVAHVASAAKQLREVEEYMRTQTDIAYEHCFVEQYEFSDLCAELSLSLDELESLPEVICKRILHKALGELAGSKKDIESKHVDAVFSLCREKEGKSIQLPYQMKAYRDEEVLVLMRVPQRELYEQLLCAEKDRVGIAPVVLSKEKLERIKESKSEHIFSVKKQDGSDFCDISVQIYKRDKNDTLFLENVCIKQLAYDKIKEDLVVRSRMEGDWFLLGQSGGKKLLQREFIDAKLPEHLRDDILLLAEESQACAILGNDFYNGRVSKDYYIDEDTQFILEIKKMTRR